MQSLIQELDKTHGKVLEQRKEMLNRLDALIGELNNSKQNIVKQVSRMNVCSCQNRRRGGISRVINFHFMQIDSDETQLQMTVAAQLNQLPKKSQVRNFRSLAVLGCFEKSS